MKEDCETQLEMLGIAYTDEVARVEHLRTEVKRLRALLGEAIEIACAQNSFHPDEADRIAAIRKEAGL